MKKKIFLSVLITALIASAASCGGTSAAKNDAVSKGGAASYGEGDRDSGAHEEGYIASPETGAVKEASEGAYYEESYSADEYSVAASDDKSDGGTGTNSQARAGLLTGGEWRDNCNFPFWTSLLGQRDDWKTLPGDWNLNTTQRVFVQVSSSGTPACGLTVKLAAGDTVLWQSVTDSKGEAYLFSEINWNRTALPDKITVETADGREVTSDIPSGSIGSAEPVKIEISEPAPMRRDLDLMFMIDTTGSMGDELRYLQTELTSVIDRVKNDSGADIRLSVNFYRDKDDDYIVRDFGFTDNIGIAVEHLEDQNAAGGGDYPEAVTTALDNGINKHEWRSGAEKLMILVLDAPPHREDGAAELATLVTDASAKGIRIIPVASSGVDTDTEFLCRSMAIATGGTYTFLTDDSGVGNFHLEPTVGDYTVEKLNDMLVRIINDYFTQEPRVHHTESPVIPERPITTEPVFTEPVPDITGPEPDITDPVTAEPPAEGTYNAIWFKTHNYYDDASMYGTKVIWTKEGLRHFFEDYGYQKEIDKLADKTDLDNYVIAVEIISLSSGSIEMGRDGAAVTIKDGQPVFVYKLTYPEVGTADMAAIYIAAAIPEEEIKVEFTKEQLEAMKTVDDALKAVAEEAGKSGKTSWADETKAKLYELAEQGLVYEDSIFYDGHFCLFDYRVKGIYASMGGAAVTDNMTDSESRETE